MTYWFGLMLLIAALVIPTGWCCCLPRLVRANFGPMLMLASMMPGMDTHTGERSFQAAPFCGNCLAVRPMPADSSLPAETPHDQTPDHPATHAALLKDRRGSLPAESAGLGHSTVPAQPIPASDCSCPSTQGHRPHDPRERMLPSAISTRHLDPAFEVRLPDFLIPRPFRLTLQTAPPGLPDDPLPPPLHGSADRSQTFLGHWLI